MDDSRKMNEEVETVDVRSVNKTGSRSQSLAMPGEETEVVKEEMSAPTWR